jgi:hypothetical protein
MNVDWFEAPLSEGQDGLTRFIKKKQYYSPSASFLVVGDHPSFTFRIDPAAPASEDK